MSVFSNEGYGTTPLKAVKTNVQRLEIFGPAGKKLLDDSPSICGVHQLELGPSGSHWLHKFEIEKSPKTAKNEGKKENTHIIFT